MSAGDVKPNIAAEGFSLKCVLRVAAYVVKDDLTIPESLQHEADASQHGEKAYFRKAVVASASGAPAGTAAPAAKLEQLRAVGAPEGGDAAPAPAKESDAV